MSIVIAYKRALAEYQEMLTFEAQLVNTMVANRDLIRSLTAAIDNAANAAIPNAAVIDALRAYRSAAMDAQIQLFDLHVALDKAISKDYVNMVSYYCAMRSAVPSGVILNPPDPPSLPIYRNLKTYIP